MTRAFALLTLALAACATVPPVAANPTTALGQTAYVDGLRVKPISIVEDSRCPVDVTCVWAGRLVILAEVDFHGGSESWRGPLTLGQPYAYGGETVTLVSAQSTKRTDTPAEPSDYRFTFAASRGR